MGVQEKRGRKLAHTDAVDRYFSGFEVVMMGDGNARIVPLSVQDIDGAKVVAETGFAMVVTEAACGELAGKLLAALRRPVLVDESGRIVMVQ